MNEIVDALPLVTFVIGLTLGVASLYWGKVIPVRAKLKTANQQVEDLKAQVQLERLSERRDGLNRVMGLFGEMLCALEQVPPSEYELRVTRPGVVDVVKNPERQEALAQIPGLVARLDRLRQRDQNEPTADSTSVQVSTDDLDELGKELEDLRERILLMLEKAVHQNEVFVVSSLDEVYKGTFSTRSIIFKRGAKPGEGDGSRDTPV